MILLLCIERANSTTMFTFALVKKLAQNIGISYSGSGKTAKSKTCNHIQYKSYCKGKCELSCWSFNNNKTHYIHTHLTKKNWVAKLILTFSRHDQYLNILISSPNNFSSQTNILLFKISMSTVGTLLY